jgi:uncharacterized surface protein with fasciclin (FAS1) repeats
MARLQWCRKHIKEVAKACDLSTHAVKEVETVAAFCDTHDAFASMPTRPIITLIRVQDEEVRERAISSCKNLLNQTNATGGKWHKTLTEKEIKKIIEDAEIEVRNEKVEKIRAEEESEEQRTGIKNITQEEVDKLMGITEEPAKDPEPVINKQGNQIYSDEEVEKIKSETPPHIIVNTIMQFEIDLYFEVMEKIGCDEDIKKHKNRMNLMIENKTLLVVG